MTKLKIIFSIALSNIGKWKTNPRIYVLLLSILAYCSSVIFPINQYCATVGFRISPWIFPFLMADGMAIFVIMLGLILLFCDAPFIDKNQPYIMLRSGRNTWVMAQILYIILASIIYFLSLAIICVLMVLPNVSFMGEWGKVINTLSASSKETPVLSLIFDPYIVVNYSPIEASLTAFILSVMVGTMIGLLVFVINMKVSRFLGSISVAFLVVLQVYMRSTTFSLTYFSPISWVSLTVLSKNQATQYPPLEFAFLVLSVILVILIILSVLAFRKRDIDVMKTI